MFSQQKQQLEICLLKSNLEEIENELVAQESLMPTLEAENEQRNRTTLEELGTVRKLSLEIERLKQERIRLGTKRVQLMCQYETLNKTIEVANESRIKITNLLNQEEQEMKLQIRKYEESLQEKANRFRRVQDFYNEEKVQVEIDKLKCNIKEVQNQLVRQQSVVDDLKRQLDAVRPDVPENILDIMGNVQLDDKIKHLNEKHDSLVEKRNFLYNQKVTGAVDFAMKKF